jgi:hypothetical protein
MFGCIINERCGGFGAGRMVWACDGHAPGPNVTTVTAPAGLLRNKERDVVVRVICCVEAAGAKDATVIECAILAPETALALLKDIPAGPPRNWRIVEGSTCEVEARLYVRQCSMQGKTRVGVGEEEVRVWSPESIIKLGKDLRAR